MALENFLPKQYWARFLSPLGHMFVVHLIGLLTPAALGFPMKRPVYQCSYLPRCRNKVFPTSTNFKSKLAVMALKWSAKYEISQSSFICVLSVLPRRTGSKAKTLDL